LPAGLLRVPAAAVSALEYQVASAGIPTVGFWARVPQYVGVEYPGAALALIRRVSDHLGVELPTEELNEAATRQRAQLDSLAQSRPEVKTMIDQLESVVDASESVSGEELAAEIERFLRQQGN
jgi:predicted ATP-grasp superfamily ATP-dependent carboligase